MKSCKRSLFIFLSLFAALAFNSVANAQACGSGGGATICLTATGSASNIALTWTVSGTATSLQVYRDTDSNPSGRTRLATVGNSVRSYTDSAAVTGTQYWYWIKFTAGGTSFNSGAATAVRGGTACSPTAITPHIFANGAWAQTSSATISSGAQITLGPQPASGGSWAWSGCGTSGSSRQQVISPTSSCAATAVYTNSCGATSNQVFTITVNQAQAGPYPNYNTSPLPPSSTGMGSNAVQLAGRFRLGWNIGNTMEAIGGETAWGNPLVSSQLLQLVRQSGFTAVRIPVSWDQYANQSTAAISATWLTRVRQVVQMSVDNGLYVIVDIHWDNGWLENNVTTAAQTAVNHKQRAYWQQIATTLRDFDERVLFASANEPNADTAQEMSVLLSYHQTFVNAVRETGGRNAYRVLVVQGPNTDIELTNTLWSQMPSDTVPGRLMAEVHFYTPWNFAGLTQDESWGNQFFYWGAPNHSTTDTAHNPTWGEEAHIDNLFGLMRSKFVNQGIPVIMGEFAAMRRSTQLTGTALSLHLASRAYYHQYVTRRALANGLLPFYWDNGGTGNFATGIFNRTNNTVADQQTLNALVQGAAP